MEILGGFKSELADESIMDADVVFMYATGVGVAPMLSLIGGAQRSGKWPKILILLMRTSEETTRNVTTEFCLTHDMDELEIPDDGIF